MKIRRERVSAAPAQACSPQRSSRVDRDSPAVGGQRQHHFQLPGSRLVVTDPANFLEARFWTTSETLDNCFADAIRPLSFTTWVGKPETGSRSLVRDADYPAR